MTDSPSPSKRMRVLVAHRYVWPENAALFSAMLKGIVERHVGWGHEVAVFAPPASAGNDQRTSWAEDLGVELIEPAIPTDRGLGARRRLANFTRYMGLLTSTLVRRPWDLVIIASYPPVFPALATRITAAVRGFQYVYYQQDLMPEMLLAHPRRSRRMLGRCLQWIDRGNVRAATATITLSEDMRKTLIKRGASGERIHVLPNYGVDEAGPFLPTLPPGPPTLVFAGNHGPIQNLGYFLKACQLAAAHCEFEVVMVGGGSELKRLKSLAARESITNVRFLDEMPRLQAQQLIAQCHAGVVAAAPGLFDVAYPSKTTSYGLAGLPVLLFASPESAVARETVANGQGVAASPTDLQHAAEAIERLVGELRAGRFDRAQIRNASLESLSAGRYFNRYETILKRCG